MCAPGPVCTCLLVRAHRAPTCCWQCCWPPVKHQVRPPRTMAPRRTCRVAQAQQSLDVHAGVHTERGATAAPYQNTRGGGGGFRSNSSRIAGNSIGTKLRFVLSSNEVRMPPPRLALPDGTPTGMPSPAMKSVLLSQQLAPNPERLCCKHCKHCRIGLVGISRV
jgi:hypothetical protein